MARKAGRHRIVVSIYPNQYGSGFKYTVGVQKCHKIGKNAYTWYDAPEFQIQSGLEVYSKFDDAEIAALKACDAISDTLVLRMEGSGGSGNYVKKNLTHKEYTINLEKYDQKLLSNTVYLDR